MGKQRKPVTAKTGGPFEVREENHMQLFERLARVKNMHGTPGAPKPKGGK